MNEDKGTRFFNKDTWKAVLIAFAVVFAGQLVLAWQYYKIEGERLPKIEQELERQKVTERVEGFLNARIAEDENQAMLFMTERAVQQKEEGDFLLFGAFERYEIKKQEKIGENGFRFHVLLSGNQGTAEQKIG